MTVLGININRTIWKAQEQKPIERKDTRNNQSKERQVEKENADMRKKRS